MSQQETEMFIMQKGCYFPQTQIPFLQEMLSKKENISFDAIWSIPLKNPTMALLLSIAGGTLGIDRFWLRQPVPAIFKLMITICYLVFYILVSMPDDPSWGVIVGMLVAMAAMLIWYIIDITSASHRAQAINYSTILTYLTH